MQAAYLHALGDLLQNLGVVVAALCIQYQPLDIGTNADGLSNWYYADPFCTVLFSVLVLWSTKEPLRRSVMVLMQEAPPHINVTAYKKGLLAVPHVRVVHDLHVWSVGSNKTLSTAHIAIDDSAHAAQVLKDCIALSRDLEIFHTTFQLEVDGFIDHMNSNHYGGIHGHEICCDLVDETPVFAPASTSRKVSEMSPSHALGHSGEEHGHDHGHGHGHGHEI
jgi:zinc transporter 2